MNLRPLAAFLLLCSLSSGCVYVAPGGGGGGGGGGTPPPSGAVRGDVGFTWTLDGLNCSQAPEVRSVRITIPGETLANGGVYPCSSLGVMGIVLHDFAPKTYSFTLEAWDAYNEPLYEGSGSFTVNGDVAVHVDMRSIRPTVDLSWELPANAQSSSPSCEAAGTPYVAVYVDGVPQQAFINGQPVRIQVGSEWRDVVPCAWGQSGQGFRVTLPDTGPHNIELYAVGQDGFKYYEYIGPGALRAAASGTATSATFRLLWAVGGLNVQWRLFDGQTGVSCSQAGVSQVWVYFWNTDTAQDEYFPGYGMPLDCSRSDAYFFLPPGDYLVYVFDSADDTGRYSSSYTAPMHLTVSAGWFADSPMVVPVYKK